jgi:hypothetical protein
VKGKGSTRPPWEYDTCRLANVKVNFIDVTFIKVRVRGLSAGTMTIMFELYSGTMVRIQDTAGKKRQKKTKKREIVLARA